MPQEKRNYPQDYINQFSQWSSRSPEEWINNTRTWPAYLRFLTVVARERPPEERSELAYNAFQEGKKMKMNTSKKDQEGADIFYFASFIWNLTDEQLDLVIKSFPQR